MIHYPMIYIHPLLCQKLQVLEHIASTGNPAHCVAIEDAGSLATVLGVFQAEFAKTQTAPISDYARTTFEALAVASLGFLAAMVDYAEIGAQGQQGDGVILLDDGALGLVGRVFDDNVKWSQSDALTRAALTLFERLIFAGLPPERLLATRVVASTIAAMHSHRATFLQRLATDVLNCASGGASSKSPLNPFFTTRSPFKFPNRDPQIWPVQSRLSRRCSMPESLRSRRITCVIRWADLLPVPLQQLQLE